MSDYIPETNDVRANYVDGTRKLHGANMRLQDVYAEFDRWLTEVKAQAWQDGWHAKDTDVNPYRQDD